MSSNPLLILLSFPYDTLLEGALGKGGAWIQEVETYLLIIYKKLRVGFHIQSLMLPKQSRV